MRENDGRSEASRPPSLIRIIFYRPDDKHHGPDDVILVQKNPLIYYHS